MKKLLLALALLLVAVGAQAAGFDDMNPGVVRIWRGKYASFKTVTCTTAGDVELLSSAEAQNLMSVYFVNKDGTNFVTICPRAAGSNQCSNADQGFPLYAKQGVPVDVSVRDRPFSCKGDTGSVKVAVLGELFDLVSPTPSPIPSHTPTPSPTPTPTP